MMALMDWHSYDALDLTDQRIRCKWASCKQCFIILLFLIAIETATNICKLISPKRPL